MMKKILNIIYWIAIIAYMAVALSFTGIKRNNTVCSNIKVNITDGKHYYFVDPDDILSILKSTNQRLLGCNCDTLNINRLENIIYRHPSIRKAKVYTSLAGDLKVDIEQRKPVLRIINAYQESFYIDEEGKPMPLSRQYTARVIVANGNIRNGFNETRKLMDYPFLDEPDSITDNIPAQLFFLVRYINRYKFWNAMIEQIYVRNDEFELIPRIGNHYVLFGDISDYQEKFRKLRLLYEKGFSTEGWEKYKYVNLKYHNQVICTKR